MVLDPANASQNILGLHEREVHRWLPILTQNVKSAIDIGAADGEYTLYFLARTKADQVFAFDPDPLSRKTFATNLALNGYVNDSRLLASSKYVRGEAGADSLTLDGLLPQIRLPAMVKIDVDGGEVDILNGACSMLQTRQIRWLIETHSAELEHECIRHLADTGYEVMIVPNAWWRIIVPEQRPSLQNRWLIGIPHNSQ